MVRHGCTLPGKFTSSPERQWLKDEISLWDGIFSRAMLALDALGSVSFGDNLATWMEIVYWQASMGFHFQHLKRLFFFFTTYDSKKKQLWRTLYQRQVQKNERIVHLLPFFVFWYRYCWWKKFGHSVTDHCLPTLPFVHLAWCVAPPWRCSWTQPGGYCTIETHTHISNVYIYIYVQYIYNIYI